MTIYGGKKVFSTFSEVVVDGFFVSCTKCGWHSKISILASSIGAMIVFKCNHCGNEHTEGGGTKWMTSLQKF
jgi:hypothetical protein